MKTGSSILKALLTISAMIGALAVLVFAGMGSCMAA
jgi:hypothetical protein